MNKLPLKDLSIEKRRFIHSLLFPLLFVIVIWIIKLYEEVDGKSLYFLGVFPQKLNGLIGVIFYPLIHGDYNHLIDNTIPLFLMSVALFYFYNQVAYRVFFLLYFISGILIWILARQSYHIGASGIIYGLGAFLFFSGIIKRNIHLLALSLLITFLYGSMVWGIFPHKFNVSWEGHLFGGLIGLCLAIIYRKKGPPPTKYIWEDEEDDELDDKDFQHFDDDDENGTGKVISLRTYLNQKVQDKNSEKE